MFCADFRNHARSTSNITVGATREALPFYNVWCPSPGGIASSSRGRGIVTEIGDVF